MRVPLEVKEFPETAASSPYLDSSVKCDWRS